MALIKSISGIRGTIGGRAGDNLTPLDIVKFTAAYGAWLGKVEAGGRVVVGRDGRLSGEIVKNLVINTLLGMGIDVIDLDLSTTPTVEMAVKWEKARGGIIITASHNPRQWNALKLLNEEGEFLSAEDGAFILEKAAAEDFSFASVDILGAYRRLENMLQKHIEAVCNYPLVDKTAIAQKKYKVVVDVINSTGSLVVPALLKALGVDEVVVLNGEVNGRFAHDPEPLPENLSALSAAVREHGASFGIAVDPDVDRLCFVCEDGTMFGEEYTLVAVADYVLSKRSGNTVSNMSSTKALKEITLQRGGEYFPSAVGEVNVVRKMKAHKAVIGGEGNGGIIVPDFHYGRDALIGIGLFLTAFSQHNKGLRAFRTGYPDYFISKNKLELGDKVNMADLLEKIAAKYSKYPLNREDGLKIQFDTDWVHLRSSNTEPIVRIYAESSSEAAAQHIALKLMEDIRKFM